jgi:hypothetical protein
MVDATRWALAAADALGTTRPKLEKTLQHNRGIRDELVLESSVFAAAMIEFATERGEWEGTTANLKTALELLTETGKAHCQNKAVWPQTVQKVAAILAREGPILRRQGIEWTDAGRRKGVRVKRLTYQPPEKAE